MDKQRTIRQNAALHLYFTQLSEALNEAGLDQRKVLKPGVEIPWSPDAVKEQIYRPIMRAQLGKESTADQTVAEIDKVFDTITRHLGERFGIHIPFPSIQIVIHNLDAQENRNGSGRKVRPMESNKSGSRPHNKRGA